jgi:hypothetical protein
MKLPNFLVVGAAKSGTTSLFDYLCQHPEIYGPTVKEPGYLLSDNRFSHVHSQKEYEKLFKKSDNFKAVGEGTVSYLADPKSPELIKEYLGDVKILIMLRNPIDMSYSLWKHLKRDLNEELGYFEAIEEWDKRKVSNEFVNSRLAIDWDYIGRAKFYNQVKRFIEGFSQVKVVFFEDFRKDNRAFYDDICQYLGVKEGVEIDFKVVNQAFKPKSKSFQKLLMKRNPVKELIKKVLPLSFLVKIKYQVLKVNEAKDDTQPLSGEERIKVKKMLESDVKMLSELLGRDLGEIWTDFKI